MRAREFVINVPITIKINGDGDPEVDMANNQTNADDEELDQNPVMTSPLQQELELKKAELGKKSPVIAKMTDDEDVGEEEPEDPQDDLSNLKTLAGLTR